MDTIVTELVAILKKETNFLAKERALMFFLFQLCAQLMSLAFEQLDKELVPEFKEKGYQIEKLNERKILTLFGEIHFSRRRYVKPNHPAVYGLDQFLGLKKHIRYSLLAQRNICELAAKLTYRKASEAIELLTCFTMSHRKINDLAIKTGKEIEIKQTDEARYEEEAIKKKSVPVLYIEGDGIQIKGREKKALTIYRFQVCEGSKKIGKNRKELINYKEFVSMNRLKAFKEIQEYIANHYHVKETVVLANSDGGSGFEEDMMRELVYEPQRFEYFLDAYHVNRKIKERLFFAKELQEPLLSAIWQAYDWQSAQTVLDTVESLLIEDFDLPVYHESLRLLQAYLERNWAKIKPFHKRQLRGIQKCLGTCESNHRAYTYRMKRQGRYWTKDGAEAMCRILSSLRNQELDKWLMTDYEPIETDEETQKRLRKALRYATSSKRNAFTEHTGAISGRIVTDGKSTTGLAILAKSYAH